MFDDIEFSDDSDSNFGCIFWLKLSDVELDNVRQLLVVIEFNCSVSCCDCVVVLLLCFLFLFDLSLNRFICNFDCEANHCERVVARELVDALDWRSQSVLEYLGVGYAGCRVRNLSLQLYAG